MALYDAINQGSKSEDPGPKKAGKSKLTWEQMRIWNKFREANKGSVTDVYNILAKENPEVAKTMSLNDLKEAFQTQSDREYIKGAEKYRKDAESGAFTDDNIAWKRRGKGVEDWGEPQYQTIDRFIPATFMREDGKQFDLGLANEHGEFENPNNYKLQNGTGIDKKDMVSRIPEGLTPDDLEEVDGKYAAFIDPVTERKKYIDLGLAYGDKERGMQIRNTFTGRRDASAKEFQEKVAKARAEGKIRIIE